MSAYRAEFGRHVETLASRPMSYFHLYCFNTVRQLGANFELLGSHLRWLDNRARLGLEDLAAGCAQIAGDAKVLQFQLARSVRRARQDDCTPVLERLEAAYAPRHRRSRGTPAMSGSAGPEAPGAALPDPTGETLRGR